MVDNPAPRATTKAACQRVCRVRDQLVDFDAGDSDDEDSN